MSENQNAPPSPRSRFQRADKEARDPLFLTERDERLLVDLFLHQAMDRSQLQELHFGSVARCNLRLRKLFDHGYVARDFHPMAPYGTQGVYRIGPKAARIVAKRLDTDAAQVKKLCLGSKRPEFLEHTLAIADFYLNVRRAIGSRSGVSLETWLPELSVRHEYDVQLPSGGGWQRQVFKPDGFLRLQVKEDLFPFFVEVDRGNASARTFGQKVDHYRQYRQSGLFAEMYGEGGSFLTLVVTTGEKRLAHLKDLVEGMGCDFFFFTTQTAIDEQGALGAIWHVPGGASPVTLVESDDLEETTPCATA